MATEQNTHTPIAALRTFTPAEIVAEGLIEAMREVDVVKSTILLALGEELSKSTCTEILENAHARLETVMGRAKATLAEVGFDERLVTITPQSHRTSEASI